MSNRHVKILLLLSITAILGCTIVPKPVVPKSPSFVGNRQDSGFYGYDSDGNGIFNAERLEEYWHLIDVYSNKFDNPPIPGEGILLTSTNTFLMDNEHMMYWRQMLYWKANHVKGREY